MRRREFITLIGGAAVMRPLAAHAQQLEKLPTIGFLNSQSPEGVVEPMRALRRGLKDSGYIEGENVAIEYRWADNQFDRLPSLADDLVRRGVAVIVTTGGPLSALAAKAASATIPIVFNVGDDPVRHGLVASLARPGGNLTGVNFLTIELATKQLELLRELLPGVARVAVLVNPASGAANETILRDVKPAARTFGLEIQVLSADTEREIDVAFESLGRERPDALFVATTPFFVSRRIQLVHLATFHRVPATYGLRDFTESGGLMSYGGSLSNAYYQVGIYAGRILKGEKPANLPVVQSSKLELVINHQTARMLRITVPPSLLAIADEVIE